MVLFEPVLLRLKEQLGVSTDKDVAALLGISPTAFNDRKKRGAFPEDKLLALATKRPDLGLDVPYILTGERAIVTALMGAVRAAAQMVERLGGTKAEQQARADVLLANVVKAAKGGLSDEEQLVLGRYRAADQALRNDVLRLLLADDRQVPAQTQSITYSQANHGNTGQVSQGGDIHVGETKRGDGRK